MQIMNFKKLFFKMYLLNKNNNLIKKDIISKEFVYNHIGILLENNQFSILTQQQENDIQRAFKVFHHIIACMNDTL